MSLPSGTIAFNQVIREYGISGSLFTSGNQSISAPAGTEWVIVQGWGGGGGGGGAGSNAGGGGAAGGYFNFAMPASQGNTVNISSVGFGGSGGLRGIGGGLASRGDEGGTTTVTFGSVTASAGGGGGGQSGDEFFAELVGGGFATITNAPPDSEALTGGEPFFDPDPSVPGGGALGITSTYLWYDGDGFRRGNGGNGGQLGANGENGTPGEVRVVFLGAFPPFGIQNYALTEYYRTTPTQFRNSGIVVPDIAANSNVPTSGTIQLTNFRNSSAHRFSSALASPTPPPPPPPSSVTFTWDNSFFSCQVPPGTSLRSSAFTGIQTVTVGDLLPNSTVQVRLVRRTSSGTPVVNGSLSSCSTGAITQNGGQFDTTVQAPAEGDCTVVYDTTGINRNWTVEVFAGNWTVPVTSGSAGVGDPVSISATFNSPPPAEPIVTVIDENSQSVSATYSQINQVISFTMPSTDASVFLSSTQIS